MLNPLNNTGPSPLGDHCLEVLENAGWKPDSLRLRSLAFASCRRGAGVTTLLVESAKAAVNEGQRVIVVDCNHRSSRLHRIFNIKQSPGVCEIIDDLSDLDSIIQESKTDGLYVLPFGKSKRMLTSDRERISELLDLLGSEFDLVLLDMPTVQCNSSFNVWYREVDAVLIVVAAGEVNLAEAQNTQTELLRSGANLRGIVLNKDTETK